jgi:hypothetical protein
MQVIFYASTHYVVIIIYGKGPVLDVIMVKISFHRNITSYKYNELFNTTFILSTFFKITLPPPHLPRSSRSPRPRARDRSGRQRRSRSAQRKGQARAAAHSPTAVGRRAKKIEQMNKR